jgi:hypothetical protein
MTTPFKELTGKRVLITKPVRKESSIELSDETKAALDAEDMKRWTSLEIYAVGADITNPNTVVGAKVYVATYALQSSEILEVDGALRMMIHEGDIAIYW